VKTEEASATGRIGDGEGSRGRKPSGEWIGWTEREESEEIGSVGGGRMIVGLELAP
jgi:hypothetical protein